MLKILIGGTLLIAGCASSQEKQSEKVDGDLCISDRSGVKSEPGVIRDATQKITVLDSGGKPLLRSDPRCPMAR